MVLELHVLDACELGPCHVFLVLGSCRPELIQGSGLRFRVEGLYGLGFRVYMAFDRAGCSVS